METKSVSNRHRRRANSPRWGSNAGTKIAHVSSQPHYRVSRPSQRFELPNSKRSRPENPLPSLSLPTPRRGINPAAPGLSKVVPRTGGLAPRGAEAVRNGVTAQKPAPPMTEKRNAAIQNLSELDDASEQTSVRLSRA